MPDRPAPPLGVKETPMTQITSLRRRHRRPFPCRLFCWRAGGSDHPAAAGGADRRDDRTRQHVRGLHGGPGHRELLSRHVRQDPDRQSRRDRLPGHQDGAAHGHPQRRGLFRRRRRGAARAHGRRGGAHRPAAGQPVLHRHRPHPRGGAGDRGAGGSSGLRLPVGAGRVRRGAGRRGRRLHRPAGGRDRGHGRQDHVEEARGGGRGLDRARLHGADRRRRRTR